MFRLYCYPSLRLHSIRPIYVLEKTIATFGTFFLLYQYTEHYIMPHIPDVNQSFAKSLLDLALPFMVSTSRAKTSLLTLIRSAILFSFISYLVSLEAF